MILLKTRDLDEVAVVEVSPDDLKGDGLPISFPDDLEEGLYLLCFEVWEGDILLSESEVYFYIVSGEYAVVGIETYPSDIKTGEYINARAYLTYPDDRDPWIRWSLDNSVLKEGYLSDMADTCLLTAPAEDGVYSLKTELFPVEPQPAHNSSAVFHSDLFVNPGDGKSRTPAEDSIYTFYVSFDSGPADIQNKDETPDIIGNPEEDQGRQDGYILDSDDGIRYHYNTLPLDADGNVQNFTLSLDFSYEDLPSADQWRLITIGDESSCFVLYYNGSDESFYAGFSGVADSLSSLSLDLLPEDGPVSLDLTYSSEGGFKRLLWVVQEELLHQSQVGDFVLPDDGETLIGSDQIIPGLPLLWFNVGVSEISTVKNAGNPDAGGTASDPLAEYPVQNDSEGTLDPPASGESEILYERQNGALPEILIENILLDSSLFTLEIVLDKDNTGKNWVFSFHDENGSPFYTFDSVSFLNTDAPGESGSDDKVLGGTPEILTLSFVRDKDGLFISRDKLIDGPYPDQNYLNFQIVPYNNDKSGLDAIKEIRLYQD